MSTENNQRIYFANLDVLRFIAAYMIVILHMFHSWTANYGIPGFLADENGELSSFGIHIDHLLANTSIGVDIFFLISGFLITYLLLAEKEKTSRIDIGRFYIRRAFRIWPLYFFLLILGPLMTAGFNEPDSNYLLHFLFAGNFELMVNGVGNIVTNHLWSICVEEHFYLICPLAIAFLPLKRIPPVLFLIMFSSIIFRATLLDEFNYWNTVYMHTLSRIDILALGSYFGYLMFVGKLKFSHPKSIRFLVYFIFVLILLNDDMKTMNDMFSITMKKYVYILFAGYWMGNFLFNKDAVFSPRKQNFLHYLGKISYGIYMFNPVVLCIIWKLFSMYSIHNGWLFFLSVNVVVLSVSALSYHFIEMPFLSLKDKFSVIKSGAPGEKNQGNRNDDEPSVPVTVTPEPVPVNPAVPGRS